nr:hypothetical protein SHINE37_44049 [Rhizobiaceae bacterium]
MGPPCKQDGSACPRKVRNAVFGKGTGANKLRSEALPCLKEDETASEERLGRAKAKPHHTHFQRQRFRAVLRTRAIPAKARSGLGRNCENNDVPSPRRRAARAVSPCAGNPRKTGLL